VDLQHPPLQGKGYAPCVPDSRKSRLGHRLMAT
jgi:hypothetical protein